MTAPPLFTSVDDVARVLAEHQWAQYTIAGEFKCKAGCKIDVLNRPVLLSKGQTSVLEAQHQAEELWAAFGQVVADKKET